MAHRNQQSSVFGEKDLTVVKRNGALVPFRRQRIQQALEAAFRDTKKVAKTASLAPE